jgi:hypothetical protein
VLRVREGGRIQNVSAVVATGVNVEGQREILGLDLVTGETGAAWTCGTAKGHPSSSGKTSRHRLNQGGDRQGNCALWRIAMTRMSCDQRTQAYARRRTAEDLSKREVLRCLKRYIARDVFRALPEATTLDRT